MSSSDDFKAALEHTYFLKKNERLFLNVALMTLCSTISVAVFFPIISGTSATSDLWDRVYAVSCVWLGAGIMKVFHHYWGDRVSEIEVNDAVDVRVEKIKNLISLCDKEIVFVSGSFHEAVYDSEIILNEMYSLPKKIKIKAYIEQGSKTNDDKRSQKMEQQDVSNFFSGEKFLEEIKRRDACIGFASSGTPHSIVVDKEAVRFELDFEKADDSEEKRAVIFYYAPKLAIKMLTAIESRVKKL